LSKVAKSLGPKSISYETFFKTELHRLHIYSVAVEAITDLDDRGLANVVIRHGLKINLTAAPDCGYATAVTPASHCTMATRNKIMVMMPETVARIAAGLDHNPLFSCCHRRLTNIILNFCHLCSRR
jgi:hypothetical protein